ncbi:HD domain-containing protein [Sediminitomix flava]|uniref:HD/PDEase domain-containing protein n=1 Tax=Sediminitomix flava TaxID=379075 RepID=A0A315ZAH7_SEDFL|nr:HD domain-containing protein [Sediminitomix flava]PWJ42159.1 hypothetical protein BC781_103409 [Sediminitomix flava]
MKAKIINDPVYGFIRINHQLIYDLVSHPYFQRLRRIKQLGLTSFVYPGALHTRFHHALGAMHLMRRTLDILIAKGHEISEEEYEAAMIAILLHDIGHGPFSHALEYTILKEVHHENISSLLMDKLNQEFDGKLDLAIRMFKNEYNRAFFHQLISSQLDMDRMDYLQRDCFFTGVIEGSIGADRLIQMIDIVDDQIVIEEKGIYSIENFLNARRMMYWQVYLHKTTVSTEHMLVQVIRRAKHLTREGVEVTCTPALAPFMKEDISFERFESEESVLKNFVLLDDYDIWGSIKFWLFHDDFVLRTLSEHLVERKIFKVHMFNEPLSVAFIEEQKNAVQKKFGFTDSEMTYMFNTNSISNSLYGSNDRILIKTKKGDIVDLLEASELFNAKSMTKSINKYFICHPR